jgi:hypothetical protein
VEVDRKRQEDAAMEPYKKIQEDFMGRVKKSADELDDPEILDCLSREDVSNPLYVRANPVNMAAIDAIKQSELAPRLIRHFLDNRADLETIYQSPTPAAAIRALAKLEGRLELATQPDPKATTTSTTPKPITPVSSTTAAVPEGSPEDMDTEGFFKYHMRKHYGGVPKGGR